jgi:DNA-binding NarL/FixJ family response regulator
MMRKTSKSISLVVADDHPVVLDGILSILQRNPDLKLLAACSEGISTIQAIKKHRPDVAVLDIAMPGLDGLEVLSRIRSEDLGSKVLFLTATATDRQILAAFEGGVMGLLLKDSASEDLVSAIRAVAAGERWFPAGLLETARSREEARKVNFDRLVGSLSVRERQVLLLVAQSFHNKQIARQLAVSEGTVKLHLYNIYKKVRVDNRTAAARLALTCLDQLAAIDGRGPPDREDVVSQRSVRRSLARR